MPLAERSWVDGWLGSLQRWGCRMASLLLGFAGCLTRQSRPGAILSSGLGYELASLPSRGYRIGPRAWEAHCFGT